MANDGEYGNIMFPFAIKGGAAAAGYPKKPTSPTSLTSSSTVPGAINLSWTAPVNTGFPAITSYTIEIVGVTTINTGNTNTTYSWTGGTKGSAYTFKVYANNSAGQSNASNSTGPTTVSGVVATGGTESTYVSGSNTYKVHQFTAVGNSTFTVSNGGSVNVLIVGGGAGQGGWSAVGNGGGKGGGGGFLETTNALSIQAYTVTVGGGGAAGGLGFNGGYGGSSVFNGQTVTGGQCVYNAVDGSSGPLGSPPGGAGNTTYTSSISGTSTVYSGNNNGGASTRKGQGSSHNNNDTTIGMPGIVIISYLL